jgi:methylphosphotriester-DNA--protein-cysteine methyltransferase
MNADDIRRTIQIITQDSLIDSASCQVPTACNLAEAGASRRQLDNAIQKLGLDDTQWSKMFRQVFDNAIKAAAAHAGDDQ